MSEGAELKRRGAGERGPVKQEVRRMFAGPGR